MAFDRPSANGSLMVATTVCANHPHPGTRLYCLPYTLLVLHYISMLWCSHVVYQMFHVTRNLICGLQPLDPKCTSGLNKVFDIGFG